MSHQKVLRQFRNVIGESPIANDEYIYWVDAEGSCVFRFAIASEQTVRFAIDIPVTAIAFADDKHLILASKVGVYLADLQCENCRFIVDPVDDLENIRINDAVVSPSGDLWFGTMNEKELERPDGAIYILKRGLGVVVKFDHGFSVSNGIAFSPCGEKVYIANMFKGQVVEYQLATNRLSYTTKKVIIQLEESEGLPDGLKTDASGNIYVCHWNGQRMSVYDKFGTRLRQIEFPAKHITRATFFGSDLSNIVVTSGSYQCDDEALTAFPESGYLFMLKALSPGLPDYSYLL